MATVEERLAHPIEQDVSYLERRMWNTSRPNPTSDSG